MPPSTGDLHYDVAQLQANAVTVQIDRGSVKVAEPPAPWSYLGHIRPYRTSIGERDTTPAALEVTLEVTAGTIGVMLLEEGTSESAIDETVVRPEDGLTTVRLFVPDPSSAGQFIVRNAGHADGPIAFRLLKIDLKCVNLQAAVDDANVLHAFYDLTIYPGTFDFALFLMAAEIARQKANLGSLHVFIVRAGRDAASRLPSGYDAIVDSDARDWRVYNLLLPMLTLFPSIGGYSVLSDRIAASALREHLSNVYPKHLHWEDVPIYSAYREVNRELARTPAALRPRATTEGLRFIQQWLNAHAQGRKMITITLRQYEFQSRRNSDIEAWGIFARELVQKGYFPVIVPDTAYALEPPPPEFEGITMFPVAALHVPLRMALYESAYLNCLSTGGPSMLMMLSERCRCLFFWKWLVEGEETSNVEQLVGTRPKVPSSLLQLRIGFTIGEDPAYLSNSQHVAWERDDLPTIRHEFDAMIARLEGQVALDRQFISST